MAHAIDPRDPNEDIVDLIVLAAVFAALVLMFY